MRAATPIAARLIETLTRTPVGLLALVNINLTELPRPARLAETAEALSDAVEALPAILTANTPGLLRHCHVADLPQFRGYNDLCVSLCAFAAYISYL